MPLVDRAPAAQPDAPTWLSVGEVARILKCHPDTIYSRLRKGVFPGRVVRVGRHWRIHRADVEAIVPLVEEYGDLAAAEFLVRDDR
jgi:excisionase family DNA binding protein